MTGPITLTEAERREIVAALQCSYNYPTSIIALIERDQPQEHAEVCEWDCSYLRYYHAPHGWYLKTEYDVKTISKCPGCGKPVREKEE